MADAGEHSREPTDTDGLPSVGVIVDRYTVQAELGRGGVAVVYRVSHNQLGSMHALKLLTIHRKSITRRLVQEGQVQASLRHPNIVAVTDLVDHASRTGLIMEYVEGPSLADWIAAHGAPERATADRWFRQILGAVAHAHAQGLVHRDIKPANVLLQPVGPDLVAKVADFGIAKVLDDELSAVSTRAGVMMGSPAYMAPEQIRDAKNVDRRADVFSLGCILYELQTGTRAFPGEDLIALFGALDTGDYADPSELVPHLPVDVQRAIRGCLRSRREDRLQSVEDVLEVLEGGDPQGFRATPVAMAHRLGDVDLVAPVMVSGHAMDPTITPTLTTGSGPPEPVDAGPRVRPAFYVAGLLAGLVATVVLTSLVTVRAVLGSGFVPEPVAQVDRPATGPAAATVPEPAAAPAPAPVADPPVAAAADPFTTPAGPAATSAPSAPEARHELAGTWMGSGGLGPLSLKVSAHQGRTVRATAEVGGLSLPLTGSLSDDGTRLSLSQVDGPARFSGTVQKGRIHGTWRRDAAGQEYQWLVVRR